MKAGQAQAGWDNVANEVWTRSVQVHAHPICRNLFTHSPSYPSTTTQSAMNGTKSYQGVYAKPGCYGTVFHEPVVTNANDDDSLSPFELPKIVRFGFFADSHHQEPYQDLAYAPVFDSQVDEPDTTHRLPV